MDESRPESLAEFIRGYSNLVGLGHSEERLKELEPEIAALFQDMAKLWGIPVGDSEMALGFAIEKVDEHA